MSSSSPLGQVFGGIGHGARRGFTESPSIPLLSEPQSRLLCINEYEETYSSEMEFLEHQKVETNDNYQKWAKAYLLLNIFGILYNLGFAVVWFRWVLDINSDDYICMELKRSIAWISIGYVAGIFLQSASILGAYAKAAIVLLVYEGLLFSIFVWRIFLDVHTINMATRSLGGCSRRTVGDLTRYTVSTIAYGAIVIILFAFTVKLLYSLRRIKKARKLCNDYKKKEILTYI